MRESGMVENDSQRAANYLLHRPIREVLVLCEYPQELSRVLVNRLQAGEAALYSMVDVPPAIPNSIQVDAAAHPCVKVPHRPRHAPAERMSKRADATLNVQPARERSASGVEFSELVNDEAHIAAPVFGALNVLVEVSDECFWPGSFSRREVSEHAAVREAHRGVVRRVNGCHHPTMTGKIFDQCLKHQCLQPPSGQED